MLKILGIVGLGVIALAMPVVLVGCGYRQEFCHATLIVTLTQEASDKATQHGYVFTVNDFLEVPLAHVSIPSIIEIGQPRVLTLTLRYPGRRNIHDAAEILRSRQDIASVSFSVAVWPMQEG